MRARFVVWVIVLFPVSAWAMLAQTDSVQWLAADAQLIVTGTLSEVRNSVITVAVRSTLKGTASKTISFPSKSLHFASDAAAAQALKSRHEMLFFMTRDEVKSTADDAVLAAIDLATAQTSMQSLVISGDGSLLSNKDDIIDAVKAQLLHKNSGAAFTFVDVQPQVIRADKSVQYYSWSPPSSQVSVKVPAQ